MQKLLQQYQGIWCMLFLLMAMSMKGQAQTVTVIKEVLDGSSGQIVVGANVSVKDEGYFDKEIQPKLDTPYSVRNIVTLRINEYSTLYLPSEFTAAVDVRIIYTKADLTEDSLTQTLTLDYNKTSASYTSRSSFAFNNAHKVTIRVVSITTTASKDILPALLLENELDVHPVYKIACTDAVDSVSDNSAALSDTSDELTVTWSAVQGADDYDLEWTYIDSTALYRYGTPLDTESLFTNNATRVTVTGTTYNIPLMYDEPGYLFYRVRSVQERDNYVRMETLWSSNYITGLGKFYYRGHERSLNWQSSIQYAEDGKRKVVVQYFDGSMRGRQTVTKDNSTNTALVAETMYDYQGRPAIAILPSPTLNTAIRYFQKFNTAAGGVEYDKNMYDSLSTAEDYLTGGADSMSVLTGTNQYYSANNPLKNEGMNKYLPVGGGYAFVQTEYTPDNTGRISRESGVGPVYKLGSNHETRYYYGAPGQNELDLLFGTDVGDKSHYFKNAVQDANGQLSVTYVDMYGRTIATALAGGADSAGLSALSGITSLTYVDTLSGKTSNVLKDLSLQTTKSQLVPIEADYTFRYKLNTPTLTIPDCNNDSVKYNIWYDVTITITDDANNQRLGGAAYVKELHNYTTGSDPIANATAQQIADSFTIHLPRGTYEITKTLSINTAALGYYKDSIFLQKNLCKTLAGYISDEATVQSSTECIPDCQACFANIGSWDSFRTEYMTLGSISATDSASYRDAAYIAYEEAVDACNALCDSVSPATDVLTQMLADVTPPSGQYAVADDSLAIFSIFYNKDETVLPPYQRDSVIYLDENGKRDTVYDELTGAWVIPQDLSPEQFANKFKTSWADALLKFHPEYCKYLTYLIYKDSYDWDEVARKVDTYDSANAKGYMNPVGLADGTVNTFNLHQDKQDPIYTNTTLVTQLRYQVGTNYKKTGYTMYTVAAGMVKCVDSTNSCYDSYSTIKSAYTASTNCTADLDMQWRNFREMYINAKHHILDSIIDKSSCTVTASQLIDSGYQPIFNTAASALSSSAPSYASATTAAGIQAAEDAVRVAMDTSYAQNCRSYIAEWVKNLASCKYDSADLYGVIIPKLVEVCKQGSDTAHPFGSSTISDGSTYAYASFEAVLAEYNSTHSITNPYECNEYMITYPAAYDAQPAYYDITLTSKPDSCQCAKLNSLYTEYTLHATDTDTSFATYVNRTRGISMTDADLTALLNSCSNSSNTCVSLENAVTIPPALQCYTGEICVTCAVVDTFYNQFLRAYPTSVPTREEGDTIQQQKNRFFVNYMNVKLGFAKEAWEYLEFIDNCTSVTLAKASSSEARSSGSSDTCTTLKNLAVDFLASHPAADGDTLTLTKQVPLSTVKHIYSFTPASTSVYSLAAVVGSTSWNGSSIYYNLRDNAIFNLSVLPRDASITNATLNLFAKPEQIELYNSNPDSAHRNSTSSELYGYFERLLGPVTVDSTTWANQPAVTEVNRVTIGPFPIGYSNSDYTDQECTNLVKDLFSAYLNGTNYGMRLRLSDEDTESKDLKSIIFWNNSTTIDYDVEPPYINVTYTASRCEEFTAYVNEQMGWSYTKAQLNSIIQRTCSSTTDICEYVSYTSYDGDLLCGKSTAIFGTVNDSITNCSDTAFFAYTLAYEKYNSYRDSLRNSFDKLYRDTAFAGGERELFTMSYSTSEYHYTLYYYDQAGNLVRTVPPSGVVINRAASWRAALAAARASGSTYVPAHTQATEYRYNTLNQVISQQTPDGGVSNFWYDRLGRLVISQNAKQIGVNAYSYTSYDGLGRISEVGEITSSTAMTNDVSRSEAGLSAWMSAARGTRTQIVQTIYDTLYTPISGTYLTQENLRNRVSWSSYFNTSGAQDSMNFATATFYSYDIHGNVGTLLQDYKGGTMSRLYNRFKKIQYKYDLISGKVNWVGYQPGEKDAFYHRYSYDAENRLTNVETSHDSIYWENEAYYEYYKHGPLSRTVLGQQQVQGVDYAYTLQGWLKGVNSTAVTPVFDMGGDGSSGSQVAKDVYGFGIHYYGKRDYTPINSAVTPFATGIGIKVLFNGNIAAISQNIPLLGKPLEYTYSYDVLNRLKGMVACKGFDSLTNAWNNSFATLSDFKETISYDGNGNIQTYIRHGNNTFAGSPLAMDSLVYNYRPGTNKLSYVTDAVDSSYYGNDIDNQDAGNYAYDSIGNVLSDVRAGVDSIKWTLYGKIARIYKHNGKVISYSYDAGGNRISKTVDSLQTWYVRDAGGNVLSVYNYGDTAINSGDLSQTEAHLYGSSRLGMATMSVNVQDTTAEATTNITGLGTGKNIIFRRGKKFFELTNHLGNVQATVSDRKIQVSGNGTTIDYYNADVVSAQDYYPFGMIQPGRSYNAGGYRYGFNGQEKSNEIKGEGNSYTAEFWEYDPGLGRRWNVDPRPEVSWSPYAVLRDNPIRMFDLKGDTTGSGTGSSTRDDPANLVGTEAHKALSDFLRKENAVSLLGNSSPLRWNTTMVLPVTGKKPDVVNMAKRQVWELKPISWHPYEGDYSNYVQAKGQIDSYVSELNYLAMINNGNYGLMKGYYTKGSNSVLDAPVFNNMQLYSRDGLYRFTYRVGNPRTGLIYYQAENLKPQPEAVLVPSSRRHHSTEDEKPPNMAVPAATGVAGAGLAAYALLFLLVL